MPFGDGGVSHEEEPPNVCLQLPIHPRVGQMAQQPPLLPPRRPVRRMGAHRQLCRSGSTSSHSNQGRIGRLSSVSSSSRTDSCSSSTDESTCSLRSCGEGGSTVAPRDQGGAASSDEDMLAFVASPQSKRRMLKDYRMRRARTENCPGQLAARGLKRAKSMSELDTAQSSPTRCSSSRSCPRVRAESSGALRANVMRRAQEQLMRANLKQLSEKQKVIHGGTPGAYESSAHWFRPAACDKQEKTERVARRLLVSKQAARFTQLYSDTVSILEAHIQPRRPSRRHSITQSDLLLYRREDSLSDCGSVGSSSPKRTILSPASVEVARRRSH